MLLINSTAIPTNLRKINKHKQREKEEKLMKQDTCCVKKIKLLIKKIKITKHILARFNQDN